MRMRETCYCVVVLALVSHGVCSMYLCKDFHVYCEQFCAFDFDALCCVNWVDPVVLYILPFDFVPLKYVLAFLDGYVRGCLCVTCTWCSMYLCKDFHVYCEQFCALR
ncbi:Protein Af-10 [Manis pentadactyla]|nr:Protein Af-10 [Manis pentadactyla]